MINRADLKYLFNIPYISLEKYEIDHNIAKIIPEEVARCNQIIALDKLETIEKSILTIGMVNPKNDDVIKTLQQKLDCIIRVFHINIQQWADAINVIYRSPFDNRKRSDYIN